MNKIITFIKNDFVNVREYWSCKFGRQIPLGIYLPYYIIVGLIALPTLPFIVLYYWIKAEILFRKFKDLA